MRARIFLFSGLVIVTLFLGLAIYGALVSNADPNQMNLEQRFEPPTWAHPMGLDENGSDVFLKVAHGARISLTVALLVVGLSLMCGLGLGSLAGGLGGKADSLIMRVIDTVHAFPNILLSLALISALGPSLFNLILVMTLSGWAGFARLVRGEVLHLKQKDYVQSTRALGGGPLRTMVLHIWPNLFGVVSVQATFAMAGTIVAEAGLSFLGLGVPASTPTWGALLNSGRQVLTEAPHVSLAAGGAIFFLVLAFNLLGDGLRDYFDPKSKLS